MLLFVCGCSSQIRIDPVSVNKPLALSQGKSLIVLGITTINPPEMETLIGVKYKVCFDDLGIVRIDRSTGLRRGMEITEWCFQCNGLTADLFSNPERKKSCDGGVSYVAYQLDPGDYALAYMLVRDIGGFLMMNFDSSLFSAEYRRVYSTKEISKNGTILNITPTFNVLPGEVVYIGDVVFDYKYVFANRVSWSHGSSVDGAKDYIAATGIGEQMKFRPWNSVSNDQTSANSLQWFTWKGVGSFGR